MPLDMRQQGNHLIREIQTGEGDISFAYKFDTDVFMSRPRFMFAGLNPDARYTLRQVNANGRKDHWEGYTFTGKFLMNRGIEINLNGEYDSCVILLDKQ